MFPWDEGGSQDSALAVYDLVHHGYVDQPLQSERFGVRKILMDRTFFRNLTRIFKEGSASARRPAVTQAAAPPNTVYQHSYGAGFEAIEPPAKIISYTVPLSSVEDIVGSKQENGKNQRYLLTLGGKKQ